MFFSRSQQYRHSQLQARGFSFCSSSANGHRPFPFLFPQQLTFQRMLSFSFCFCGKAVQRTPTVHCEEGQGRKWLCLPGLCTLTALFFCLKKGKERDTETEREGCKVKKKKTTSERIPKKPQNKTKQKNPTKTKTKPNHQLKFPKYTFTKGGECGFPVDFLGDLVKQANMAKRPQNPKQQHTDEPKVTKGATTFWVERNTMAIWRNAARYCWFKVNLFIPEPYTNSQLLSHACLFHAEGDLGVLVTEQYVCNTC